MTNRIGFALVIAAATLAAQDRPLPDQESFLTETRTHLQTDSTLQSSYVYVETRREQKLDKQGRVGDDGRTVVVGADLRSDLQRLSQLGL